MGIDLNHSEKLSVMNESISKIVHEPDGMIAQAMKHRGYEMKDGIDTASRHLSENEIKGIVEEYIQNTEIPTVMENEVPILETQLELPLEPPMEPTEIPTERNEHSNWIFAKITGIGALVGGAWFWKNRLWKKEKSNLGNGEIQSIATVPTDSDTLVEHSEVIPETSEIARPENPVETESNTPTNP